MFCPFCGHQNRDGKRFCRQCGRTLPAARASAVTSALPPNIDYTDDSDDTAAMMAIVQQSVNPPASEVESVTEPIQYQSSHMNESSSEIRAKPNVSANAELNSNLDAELMTSRSIGGSAGLSVEELEDQLNQFTQPLLPDTVDFEIPKSLPPFPGNGDSNYEKPANGKPVALQNSSLPASNQTSSRSAFGADVGRDSRAVSMGKSPDTGQTAVSEAFSEAFFEDTHDHTDELDILDRTMDKTAEVPILTASDIPDKSDKSDKLAREARPSPAQAQRARTATSFLSVLDIQDESLNLAQTRRTERFIMMAAIILALVGVGFLIWLLS